MNILCRRSLKGGGGWRCWVTEEFCSKGSPFSNQDATFGLRGGGEWEKGRVKNFKKKRLAFGLIITS